MCSRVTWLPVLLFCFSNWSLLSGIFLSAATVNQTQRIFILYPHKTHFVVVPLMSEGNKQEYRGVINDYVNWCECNNLHGGKYKYPGVHLKNKLDSPVLSICWGDWGNLSKTIFSLKIPCFSHKHVEISRRVIKMIQFWVMKATGKKKQYAVDQRHPRWYLALANSCSSPTPIIQETQLSFSMLQIWAGDPFDHTLIPAQLAESSELCRRKWQKETKWGGEKETELDLRMLWGSTCLGTMLNKHQ